jgi:hypothetical protein
VDAAEAEFSPGWQRALLEHPEEKAPPLLISFAREQKTNLNPQASLQQSPRDWEIAFFCEDFSIS